MRLIETYSSMKDIDIGVQDGDRTAIALAQRINNASSIKHQVIYDSNHSLYYGFTSSNITDAKLTSASFYKYRSYCKANRYPTMKYADFANSVKTVSSKEYEGIKADKGTRFKDLNKAY